MPRFWCDHPRQCDGEFCLAAAELRVGNTINLIANCRLAHIGTNLLNEAREVATKCQWRLWTYLALALTNDCVLWSDACCSNAHQHLSFARRRPRNIFDNDDLRRSETVDAHGLHVNHTALTKTPWALCLATAEFPTVRSIQLIGHGRIVGIRYTIPISGRTGLTKAEPGVRDE